MRKKFTMLLASLFLVMGTAWAENVLFNANSTTALPGTKENNQYTWRSSEMTAPDGFTTLRLTFLKTTNNGTDPGGHPHVNIAEFYLYDNTGTPVALTAENFSSNATETNEGKSGLHRLCDGTFAKLESDGVNDWYWHSFWSSDAGAYHYLEINVADIPNLSTFAVGYVTRQENGSPTELLVTTGSSTEDVAAQYPGVTVTYNHLLGGVSKKTEARDAVVGASYPAPSLPWGVKVVTDLSGTVTEGGTKDIEVAYNGELPFTPSASFETAHWHYLKFTKDARYIRYNESDTYIPTDLDKIYPNVDPEAYAWAFVGDPYTGEYKLMNRKAGSTKVLSSTRNIYDGNTGGNTCPLMKEESGINEETDNKTWIVAQSTSIAGVNGMYIGLKTSNNETKYMNSRSGKLAFWTQGQGDGSTFQTEEFGYKPAFVVAKDEALKSLQALAAIASDKTETAKTAIEALDPTTSDEALAAFTTLNEQMNSVVSGEYFTLQNKNNTSIYLTTDGTNASATTTADIKAYWTLKNKNGLFYLYNKYNNAYLQRVPTSNETKITITSQDNLAAAYRAVLPTSENNVWALTSFESAGNNETKFLHKAGDNRIVRWTATAEASQWTIAEVDYAAAFSALVEAQLDGKVFSDNPALGEYPTSAKDAFDALKEAYLANPTDENERALVSGIDELEKAKNLPVFIIESMKDYALEQGIYEIDASNLKFKEKNEFDKTMWWSFDMTSTEVSCTDRVVVRNVGSGNLFWNAEYVSVIETEPAVEGDGVFMFKTNGTGNPVHAQKDNSAIVRWSSADANAVGGASTWKFTYIGNSYDLGEYDDEYAAACAALEAAYIAKSDWLSLFGDGVGQYSGDSESFLAPLTTGTEMLTVKLSVLLENYDTQDIVDATTAITAMQEADILTNENFTLNLPTAGKYYRIKGANAGAENYLTGNVTVNGNHIALQADKNNATIFRYVNNKLLAVESNLYVAMKNDFYTFQILEKNAQDITFAASSRRAGAYTIKSNRFFHYNRNNTEGTFLDRCSSDPADHTAHDWYLEEVAESEVPANTNLLTDINNLSGEASYRIYGDRGFIYVADDGNMKGTNNANVAYNPNNDKHHFAIVTIGENKYLYNVGAKKFVKKNGTGGVALTDWPELAITIEPKEKANENDGFDWVIKSDGNRLNLSDASGHTYGIYTNYNTEDAGNVWAIYKVGSFAPAEAQSMKKVIVNYTIDGVAATETVGVAAGGTLNFSYEFATVTSCKMGEEAQTITDGACSVTIQDNVTISVAMTSDNRLFRLKNTASSKYMTIVTPEAAEGVQIKDRADDPVKQAFRIVLANWQGKYNIKSTENYFMASSTGGWDYGAYQTTTNEAGRVHELEALDEGKYGLKTLNGYAGPNKNATSDGSPLYSNHTADNNGREWELEELPKSSITYIYKYGEEEITREVHESVYEGLAAPATAVTLPFGFSYDNAALPTTKGAGNEEVVITCTLSLPFQYAATYQAIEENGYWYYLKFDSDNNYYLHHADGQNYIALDSKAVDKTNKDAYSWGFVGDPINGFKIVNRAAGSTKILSSSTTMAGETGAETWPIMTVAEGLAEGNNTLWIPTASAHADGGFFLAQKDHPTHRMNNRGSKLAYWTGGAGAGSTFVAVARPFGPVAELEALLVEAEKLKTEVDGNIGAIIGKYSQETAEALTTAVETAQKKVDDETAITADVEALQNAIDATKIILPTPGTYYQFHSAYTKFTERRALFSNGNTARWKILNNADKSFYWLAEKTAEGNIVLKNAADSKYLIGKANNYTDWTVASTSEGAEMTVKISGGEGEAMEYAIILAGRHMHAANSGNGVATESNIVSWETNETGSCSSWYIVEAELPSFFTVTYKFNYQGDTKYTQTEQVGVGGTYPEMNVFLPYGVTSNFELPAGTVQAASEHEFELTVNKTLPFETGKWYYAQMHADYTAYVGDDEGLTWWNNTYVATKDTEKYLWGFVGDLWSGYKMVNKATGQAIHSTGSGDASLSSEGTAFIASNSDKGGDWFCLKYPDNAYYLNANANDGHHKIEHWDDNDAGSSILLTEYKTYSITIADDIVYGTFYSDDRLLIPADVEVYIATELASNYVALEQVEGVLPAHTGVLLKNAGTYNFVTSAAEPATVTTEGTNISENHFVGTTTKTLIEAADKTTYYVLAKGSKGVGLYKAKLNKDKDGEEGTTHFYNNANKVYLPVVNDDADDEHAAEALVMRFGRGQGTTEIELPTAKGQQPTAVYDLQGRRVLNPTKGMYIINGKKVVIR